MQACVEGSEASSEHHTGESKFFTSVFQLSPLPVCAFQLCQSHPVSAVPNCMDCKYRCAVHALLPLNKLFCLQALLRWALMSSAAVLLAACLFSCLVGISIWVADGVSVFDTRPSCALMVTVSAVLACIATHTELGRRLWSALWVSPHSFLPQFAYLPVMSRGRALLSNAAKYREKEHWVMWF